MFICDFEHREKLTGFSSSI